MANLFGKISDEFVPDQPEKTFCGSVLLCFKFVSAEVLEVFRFGGRGKLSLTQFLIGEEVRYRPNRTFDASRFLLNQCARPAQRVAGEEKRRQMILAFTLPSMSALTGEKATGPMTSTEEEDAVMLGRADLTIEDAIRCPRERTEDGGQRLDCVEELGSSNGIALVGVKRDIDK